MTLRVSAVQTVETLSTRRDRANDHALAHGVLRAEPVAKFFDDADRLVAEDQAWAHGILTLHDVHVSPANGGGRNPDHGLARLRAAASAPPRGG